MENTSPKRFLSPREAYSRVGLSRVTAWKMRKVGQFPEPIQISTGRKAYLESDIDAWIDGRVAASRGVRA